MSYPDNTDSVAQEFVDLVRRMLAYDPETGLLTNRVARIHSPVGAVLGTADRDGYLRIRFCGEQYLVHRLIWLLVHGEWPAVEIDHWDTDPSNNRLANLRLATRGQNCSNRRAARDLPKGAYRDRTRFRACITFHRRVIYLGSFDTPEEAHQAYLAKARELRGEFARAA